MKRLKANLIAFLYVLPLCLIAVFAVRCAEPPGTPEGPPAPHGLIVGKLKLYTVTLPAGLVPGFDVMFRGDNKQKYNTLPAGYDGFRFQGQGVGVTHVKAPYSPTEWHNSSIFIGPFDGAVELVGMTIHGARDKAVHAGLATKSWNGTDYVVSSPVRPAFQVSLTDCEVVADVEADGKRPKWGLFGYQCDWFVRRTVIRWKEGVEHGSYEHGYSRFGSTWINVDVESSGAENSKVRNDNQEIQWVSGAKVVRRGCTFRDWYQPWSWRGGGGCVFQGTGCDVLIKRCYFWGAAGLRGRCISVDDGGVRVDGRPDYYDAVTGSIGGTFANGYVTVQECAIYGGPGVSSYSDLMNFVNWHGSATYPHKPARAVTITGCGVYGDHMLAKFGNSTWTVTGCNTPLVEEQCDAIGMDTGTEASVNGNPLVKFSTGKTVIVPGDPLPQAAPE